MIKENGVCMYVSIHIYIIEYYISHRKNETLPFRAVCIKLENIVLSDIIRHKKANAKCSYLCRETKKKIISYKLRINKCKGENN